MFFLSQKAQRSRNAGGSGRGLGENGGFCCVGGCCVCCTIAKSWRYLAGQVDYTLRHSVSGTWVGVRGSPGCSRGSLLHAPLPKRFSRVGALTVRLSRLSVSFEAFLSPPDLRMHSQSDGLNDEKSGSTSFVNVGGTDVSVFGRKVTRSKTMAQVPSSTRPQCCIGAAHAKAEQLAEWRTFSNRPLRPA